MDKEYAQLDELAAKLIEVGETIQKLRNENKELLRIARKMHTWIFLHTCDEQAAYDDIGLTDEQNAMLGYGGSYILSGREAEDPSAEDAQQSDSRNDSETS